MYLENYDPLCVFHIKANAFIIVPIGALQLYSTIVSYLQTYTVGVVNYLYLYNDIINVNSFQNCCKNSQYCTDNYRESG